MDGDVAKLNMNAQNHAKVIEWAQRDLHAKHPIMAVSGGNWEKRENHWSKEKVDYYAEGKSTSRLNMKQGDSG